jgi:uncharacterized membrane protein
MPEQPLHLVRRNLIYGAILLVVIFLVIWLAGGRNPRYFDLFTKGFGRLHPHLPDLALLKHQSPVILIHLGFALAASGLGAVQLMAPKGTIPHRVMGWAWLLIMGTVAISSFFIRQINHGHFSLIHILSVVVLLQIPFIIWAARTHRIKRHANMASGLFAGALIVAGLLAFMPGRLMWQLFFG